MKNWFQKKEIARRPVLIIGDLICDVYHFLADGGISTETGNTLGLYKETKLNWGGAGLLVRNFLALGGRATFVSLLGDDDYASEVESFEYENLRKVFFKEAGRRTIVKERYLIGSKKVLRINRGDSRFIGAKTHSAILSFFKKNIGSFGKILIADYRHGLMTKSLIKAILTEAQKQKVPVYVDSQVVRGESNHFWYRGADLICLNQKEARSVDSKFNEKDLRGSLARLQTILKVKSVIVKLGERGAASLLHKVFFETPALKVKVVDPVGAGDAFFAALAVSDKLDKEAVSFANKWAGFSTTIQGTEPPKLSDFKKIYETV